MIDPLVAAVFAIFFVFIALDFVHRARTFPPVPFWRFMGLLGTVCYFAVAYYAPFLWDEWLAEHTLVSIRDWPLWQQVGVGFLVFQFGTYVWHRTMHNVPFLWRHLHQMHHSAERVDIWGAFYFHPLDAAGFTLVGSLALVWGLCVAPEAAVIVTIMAAFCSMFQHANVATPRWLGVFITRPESHAVHHQRGLHAYNYGDIPLFDILLGTFRNPKEWHGEAGFYDGASKRLWSLLVGRDIADGDPVKPTVQTAA